jgi:hypothetical protein
MITKCPKCGVDDKPISGMLLTTEVYYIPFYDNVGKKHHHDKNYSYWYLRCKSCGNLWKESDTLQRGCWCGWINGKGGGYDGTKLE